MTRRLTGDLSQASDWRRSLVDAPANRRAARLQDLLRGLGALNSAASTPPSTSGAAAPLNSAEAGHGRQNVLVLAEQALRIDPDSAELRQASADLQRIADTWDAFSAGGRASALGAVAARVAGEAKKAMDAAPAQTPSVAAALRGAFADALHVPGGTR